MTDGYQLFTGPDLFEDPVHPAGYSLILTVLGAATHEVAAPVLVQHLAGFASAFLLYAATRRITGSAAAGLLPAGAVLLSADQIFLEHAIMAESWALLAVSGGLYAAVRTMDAPPTWSRWSVLAGAALGIAVTIRTASVLLIPIVLVAVVLVDSSPLKRWRLALGFAASASVVLLCFATANATFGERFGVSSSPGLYLYVRAAQFADCREFKPPRGTEVLCETVPASQRGGARYYLTNPQAPLQRHMGGFGRADGDLVGEWAQRAIRAQPRDYARTVWEHLRVYWVPGSEPDRPEFGADLDHNLDFSKHDAVWTFEGSLEEFYDDFETHVYSPGLQVLHNWQRVVRFGGTALTLATILTIVGLFVGSRRSRLGVLMFGIGGLSLIVPAALTGTYVGRYTVPMAGPLAAAAAIAVLEMYRRWRRHADSRPAAGLGPGSA